MEKKRTIEVGVAEGQGDDAPSEGIVEEKEMVEVIPGENMIEKMQEVEVEPEVEEKLVERPPAKLQHDRDHYVALTQDASKSPFVENYINTYCFQTGRII